MNKKFGRKVDVKADLITRLQTGIQDADRISLTREFDLARHLAGVVTQSFVIYRRRK